MAEQTVRLQTLHQLDYGRPGVAFDELFKGLLADCMDRPGLDKARKLVVTLHVLPVTNEAGECERIALQLRLGAKIPELGSGITIGRATVKGELRFQSEATDDPNQATIDQELERNEHDG